MKVPDSKTVASRIRSNLGDTNNGLVSTLPRHVRKTRSTVSENGNVIKVSPLSASIDCEHDDTSLSDGDIIKGLRDRYIQTLQQKSKDSKE